MDIEELQAMVAQYQQWLADSKLQEALLSAKVQKLTRQLEEASPNES